MMINEVNDERIGEDVGCRSKVPGTVGLYLTYLSVLHLLHRFPGLLLLSSV